MNLLVQKNGGGKAPVPGALPPPPPSYATGVQYTRGVLISGCPHLGVPLSVLRALTLVDSLFLGDSDTPLKDIVTSCVCMSPEPSAAAGGVSPVGVVSEELLLLLGDWGSVSSGVLALGFLFTAK